MNRTGQINDMQNFLRRQRPARKGQRHHEYADQQQQQFTLQPLHVQALKLVDIGRVVGLRRDVDDPHVDMQPIGIDEAGGKG